MGMREAERIGEGNEGCREGEGGGNGARLAIGKWRMHDMPAKGRRGM